MTVIAYRDGVLAADKKSTWASLGHTTTKIRRMRDGSIAGCTGDSAICRELLDWYDAGAEPDRYPDRKSTSNMLLINRDHRVLFFDGSPTPIEFEDPWVAMGSGRDYAIAAMHLGCSAKQAVDVACIYDDGCGHGIDVLELDP